MAETRSVKLRVDLVNRAADAAKAAGYATPEELIEHAIEQWLEKIARPSAKPGGDAATVNDKLRGLGYM